MADGFTYNIQMAGYAFDRYDEKGAVTYEQFVKEFRSFPWATQVGKANGGSEPTLSVRNQSKGTDYWVSAATHKSAYVYLMGFIYPKEKRGLFGFGTPKPIRWLEIFVAEDAKTVEDTFRTFFSGNDEQLLGQLRLLPKFAEMEAKH
jgi:hypothetical protein